MKAKLGFRRIIATILVAAITIGFAPAIFGNNIVAASGETMIDLIEINGITLPVEGAYPTVNGYTTNASEAGYTVERLEWTTSYSQAFEAGKTYKLYIQLKPTSTSIFPDDVKHDIALKVNGKSYVSEDTEEAGTACIWQSGSCLYINVFYQTAGDLCSVDFNQNGGSGNMDSMQITENNDLTLPECAFVAPENKEFDYWEIYGDPYLPGETYTVTEDTTVKAVWSSIETFTVSYNLGVHASPIEPVTNIPRNSCLSNYLPTVTPDEGWEFCGWYKDAEFTQAVSDGDKVRCNSTLYAKMQEIVNPIVIDQIVIDNLITPVAGKLPTVSGVTTNASSGYIVERLEWTTSYSQAFEAGKTYKLYIQLKPTSTSIFPDDVKHDIALKVNGKSYVSEDTEEAGTACIWQSGSSLYINVFYEAIVNYTVSFNSNGGSAVESQTVADGNKATKPTDPAKSGYTFGGWYTDSACSSAYDFNSAVTTDITLYAKWTVVATPDPITPDPITPDPVTPDPVIPAPEPEFDPYANVPTLTGGIAHVQDIGDVSYTTEAGVLTIGTRGMEKRLEEITINFENTTGLSGTLEYRVHVQDIGWMEWVPAGTKCGTEGMSKRIEAIEIRLTGELAEYYSVQYCVHIQDYGDMQGWVKDGALAGTTGESKRIEELKIKIVPANSGTSMSVKYRVHVQDYGWEGAYASNGQMSGTSGESKRLEGIEIFLDGTQYTGGIKFKTHVQDYGWQGWSYDGEMSGTQGESKRLEGICIELYGEVAEYYDIYYRVHAQDIGWMAWAKNGECAGTAGRSARLEGIQIVLVPKGSPAPSATYEGITAVTDKAFIEGF